MAAPDDANSLSSPPEPAPAPPPVPPDALKPWYYQGWFIVPTFVWWPSSAVLFIRSPWHNGVVSGALSWAWVIVGGGFIFLRLKDNLDERGNPFLGLINGEVQADLTLLALVAPGIVLTIVTQALWLTRDRPRIRRIRSAGGFAAYESEEPGNGTPGQTRTPAETPRSRSNRGGARRRRRRR
ncbi:MAG: hypothetical protein OXE87_13755 [Chloroflexi bacterium]|nr:hypothetical protein [Chloroflexota bacterium]